MPPEGDRLAKDQIGVLRAWIDRGANWDEATEYHLALKEVTLPQGDGHPIDRLLAVYLDKHGIQLGPPVSDERFARRAALDLIGQPITDEQLTEFLVDKRRNKREDFVRRLLSDHENYVAHWITFWRDHLRIGSDVAGGIFDSDESRAPQTWLKDDTDSRCTVRPICAGPSSR